MDVQVRESTRRARVPPIERDLDSYLDAVEHATSVFREALDGYLQAGPDGTAWRQAKHIADHLRAIDGVQQKLVTRARDLSLQDPLFAGMRNPLLAVGRLLREMKRQITGFAIEAGFTAPGRRVPDHLVSSMHELADDVCGAVESLVEAYRPCTFWWHRLPGEDEGRGVCWYESLADEHSTQLIRRILADAELSVGAKLPLTQLVEEIDSIADHAAAVDAEMRCLRRRKFLSSVGQRVS